MTKKKKIELSEVELDPVTSLDDLDELGKGEVFPFKDKEWTIPAVSQLTAERMSAMHSAITEAIDEENIEAAVKFDIDYVHLAMSAGMIDAEAKELREELESWPKVVLGRISRFIATTMMGPIEELVPEEKKEEAKK